MMSHFDDSQGPIDFTIMSNHRPTDSYGCQNHFLLGSYEIRESLLDLHTSASNQGFPGVTSCELQPSASSCHVNMSDGPYETGRRSQRGSPDWPAPVWHTQAWNSDPPIQPAWRSAPTEGPLHGSNADQIQVSGADAACLRDYVIASGTQFANEDFSVASTGTVSATEDSRAYGFQSHVPCQSSFVNGCGQLAALGSLPVGNLSDPMSRDNGSMSDHEILASANQFPAENASTFGLPRQYSDVSFQGMNGGPFNAAPGTRALYNDTQQASDLGGYRRNPPKSSSGSDSGLEPIYDNRTPQLQHSEDHGAHLSYSHGSRGELSGASSVNATRLTVPISRERHLGSAHRTFARHQNRILAHRHRNVGNLQQKNPPEPLGRALQTISPRSNDQEDQTPLRTGHGRRGPLSKPARTHAGAVRKIGACNGCRKSKIKVRTPRCTHFHRLINSSVSIKMIKSSNSVHNRDLPHRLRRRLREALHKGL